MEIKTRKIREADLELVRYWRNKEFVRNQMLTKDLISSEDQKKWFSNMNRSLIHFFIYSLEKVDVGCIVCKVTNLEKGIFDVGVYCGNSEFIGHPINLMSVIYIHDYSFLNLTLKTSITTIKKDNKNSLRLNKKIGYVFYKNYNNNFDEYSLDKSMYLKEKKGLDKILNYFKKSGM